MIFVPAVKYNQRMRAFGYYTLVADIEVAGIECAGSEGIKTSTKTLSFRSLFQYIDIHMTFA
jgi:hypothetical protein